MEYGNITTSKARKSGMNSLQLAERRALRAALCKPRGYKTEKLYREAGITPIDQRIQAMANKTRIRLGLNSKRRKILEDRITTLG